MILQEVATEQQAEQWVHHPDDAAAFMAETGAGAYPPLFVGRLVQAIEVPSGSVASGGDDPPEPPRE